MRMTDDTVLHLLDGAITGLPVIAVAYFTVRASAGDLVALGKQTIPTPVRWKGGIRLRLVRISQWRQTSDELKFGVRVDAGFDRGMLVWLLAGTLCAVLGRATSDVPRLCRMLAGGAVACLILSLTTSL